METSTAHVLKDSDGFYWEIRSPEGETVCCSASYFTKYDETKDDLKFALALVRGPVTRVDTGAEV